MMLGLYLVFTVSIFLHLTARVSMLAEVRLDFLLMATIVLGLFVSGRVLSSRTWSDGTSRRLLYFLIYVLLSIPFVKWPGSALRFGLENYLKVIVFFYFTTLIIDTEKRLRIFILVFVLCQSVRILEPLYLHWTTGYWGDKAFSHVGGEMSRLDRLSGAPNDVVNPNQLAWIVNTTIPFVYFLLWKHGGYLMKLIAAACVPLFLTTLALTGSRSGLVSLLALAGTIAVLEKINLKRVLIGGAGLLSVLAVAIIFLSPELKTRYLSLVDKDLVGADTVEGRITSIPRAMTTVMERPVFGHGLGTSVETNVNVLKGRRGITHNLYLEVAQELGLFGAIFFLYYIMGIFGTLRKSVRVLGEIPEGTWLLLLTQSVLAWGVMNLVYSLSCFGLTSWEWYFFGGVAVVCFRLAGDLQECRH